ncbi:MAG: cyclic nucleotide-binding domain-containing protein [Deltaproteobacteria bacterium]|jgi:CRP-like cAMP-binding protein/glyoxylase-like metal-dependent hydrolase (beta-lactamase superfamily II)|nr:cyclic nucleotide-binding domain-containing protein [Deltaproteobacteria bacterium]
MRFEVHAVYPGVALAVVGQQSVLFGVPADAFKAVKQHCMDHNLPFPRTLVAPQSMLINATPQFNPEFFLYDFLFVYGAAFTPGLADERLILVLDEPQIEGVMHALKTTLTGPTLDDMLGYTDEDGSKVMSQSTAEFLVGVSDHMAIKQGDEPRELKTMVTTLHFDSKDEVDVLDGDLTIQRDGPSAFILRSGNEQHRVSLEVPRRVIPFSKLPPPSATQTPITLGVKPLGSRSGFDLSGPCTGFLIWVNGRICIYDGPVATRYLLERQGISVEDIDMVVLSHCHEDHMGAFVELILSGHKPRFFTTEPIYQSTLIKLSTYFKQPKEEIAKYLDYHRVTEGEPFDALGAEFQLFYTIHAIPTVGLTVSLTDALGEHHAVTISGDTLHHDGLDKLKIDGILPEEHFQRMRNLVPETRNQNHCYFCDVGESIIHGHPKDFVNNDNRVIYYHCPENEYTRSFGRELAQPGRTITVVEPRKMHPVTPLRILKAMKHLGLDESKCMTSILYGGKTRHVGDGDLLLDGSPEDRETLSIVVSGTASVTYEDDDKQPVTTYLGPGEFFGGRDQLRQLDPVDVTVKATTPMELFDISGAIFRECIERNDLSSILEQISRKRPFIDTIDLFDDIELSLLNTLARQSEETDFDEGTRLVEENQRDSAFYLLLEGTVEVRLNGSGATVVDADSDFNYVATAPLMCPETTEPYSVVAQTPVKALVITGSTIQDLCRDNMRVRYAMDQLHTNRRNKAN